jgi:hypothetical protein
MSKVPSELNGYHVIASVPGMAEAHAVLVHRPNSTPHRYVVATWHPSLDTHWHHGYYTDDFFEAVECLRVRLSRAA